MTIANYILSALRNEVQLIRRLLFSRLFISPKLRQEIIDQFQILYHESAILGETWENTTFLGNKIAKCPLDLWVYQEIIYELRPDIIIETGTFYGGSARYLASLCDLIDHGSIITIDISEKQNRPQHKRIEYITGSSVSEDTIKKVKQRIPHDASVMVVLDSDHTKDHVLKELTIYGKLVTKGNYVIVEDSNVNGHPVSPDHGPGPMEAIDEFLKIQHNYVIDKKREKFLLTFNPKGYLRRKK